MKVKEDTLAGVTWKMVSAEKSLVTVTCGWQKMCVSWCDMGDGVSREVACDGDM